MSFFAVLEEYVSNLPSKTEILDVFGVGTNTFNIMNDDYQSTGKSKLYQI